MQIGRIGVGLLSMAMAMALTAGTATAQDEDAKKKKPEAGQDEKKKKKKKPRAIFGIPPLKVLAKELGLDKKTAKKLAPAYKEATKAFGEIRKARKGGGDKKALGKKTKAARTKFIAAINKVLNEEQAKKFKEISDKKKGKKKKSDKKSNKKSKDSKEESDK